MSNAEEHAMAMRRTLAGARTDHEEKRLVRDFQRWCNFPTQLKTQYLDAFSSSVSSRPSPAKVFLDTFPGFPMRVVTGPFKTVLKCTRIDHLEGEKVGGELRDTYERHVESNMDAVRNELPIVMLMRLYRMKEPHVFHNVDPVAGRFFDGEGRFYTHKSRYGYWVTMHPLEFFVRLKCIQACLEEYFANAMAGRP